MMGRHQETAHNLQAFSQKKWGIPFLFLIVILSGCSHHGSNNKQGYSHDSASYSHEGTDRGFHHHFSQSMVEELKMTDKQKDAFNRLKTDYDKMVVKKTADIRMAEVDLAALLAKDEPDRQAVQEQVQAMGKIKEEMMMARVDSLLNLKSILSKDQYDQFRKILHQRMTHGMGHMAHEAL